MKRILRFNKKGSVTVFLTSILITMIMVSMVFVHAARSICGASYSDAVLELAGRSVLAEFDRRLKDQYGLFAFHGSEDRVESAIKLYADSSFNKKIPGEIRLINGAITDMFRLELENADANLAAYSLMDVNVFEKQIEEYMDYMIAQRGLEFVKGMWKKETSGRAAPDIERMLMSEVEIYGFPSGGNAPNGINITALLSDGIPSLEDVLSESAASFKVNEYILSNFKYNVGGDKEKDTFFQNEVEYILYGKTSDKDNLRRFRSQFVLLRTALNVAHIYACPSKYDATMTLAELLTPGPEAVITQGILIAAWGAAEAENDARMLMLGKNVSFIKTEPTWALELREMLSGTGDKEYVAPDSDAGIAYADYLRLFLYFERRETKLLRTMDLIQLNLRGSYYGDFLIKDHYTGFSLSADVSGKKFEYEHKY